MGRIIPEERQGWQAMSKSSEVRTYIPLRSFSLNISPDSLQKRIDPRDVLVPPANVRKGEP